LACAVKGGKEIVIIGHTDCQVAKTTMMQLTDRFRALGIERARLPENLNEYFGLFASERQNVIKAAEFVRQSPLIGPHIPVHGLLVDITTGKLEWLVNGYQSLPSSSDVLAHANRPAEPLGSTTALPAFQMGEMKFPESKIGESNSAVSQWMTELHVVEPQPADKPPKVEPPAEQIPAPPRIRPKPYLQKAKK
jgi:carbonic anhydrase